MSYHRLTRYFTYSITLVRSVTAWNYEIKLVKTITRTEDFGVHKAGKIVIRAYSSVDTDNFEEDERLQMCRNASKIEHLVNRKIKFLTNAGKTGQKTCYTLQVSEENPDNDGELELGLAFRCPTQPLIYLQLHYVDEKVWVIIKANELPAICNVPDYYTLKLVEDVIDVDRLQSTSFVHATLPSLDLNECADEIRLAMCRKATKVGILRGSEIEILKDNDSQYTLRAAIFYALKLKSHSELILVFQCPSEPSIYLQVFKNDEETQTILTIVRDSDLFIK